MADFQVNKLTKRAEFKDLDRLSQLPESILDYILSFLSTEEASRTSLLSKYWRHRWLCGANELDFNTSRLITPQDLGRSTRYHLDAPVMSGLFFEWVINVLESYNVVVEEEASGLRKLRFQFPLELDSWYRMKVDEWLTFAFAKRVQSLELDLFLYSDPKYTSSSSDAGYYFPTRLIAETETDFSFLRSLSLVEVEVTSKDIGTFLERFRLLEHLRVCHSSALTSIEIGSSSSALKHLEVINPMMTSVSIRNTCLVSLAFNWVKFLVLENNPKLVSLRVTGFRGYRFVGFYGGGHGAQLRILSSCLSKLQIQILNLNLNYCPNDDDENLDQHPELNELKELALTVDPERKETPARLATLLGLSPNLEKLVLQFVSPSKSGKRKAFKKGSFTLHHLKTLEVRGYYGIVESEDKLLKFIFQLVAAPLEKIIFDPRTLSRSEDGDEPEAGGPKAEMSVEMRANRLKRVAETGAKRFKGGKKRARFSEAEFIVKD